MVGDVHLMGWKWNIICSITWEVKGTVMFVCLTALPFELDIISPSVFCLLSGWDCDGTWGGIWYQCWRGECPKHCNSSGCCWSYWEACREERLEETMIRLGDHFSPALMFLVSLL